MALGLGHSRYAPQNVAGAPSSAASSVRASPTKSHPVRETPVEAKVVVPRVRKELKPENANKWKNVFDFTSNLKAAPGFNNKTAFKRLTDSGASRDQASFESPRNLPQDASSRVVPAQGQFCPRSCFVNHLITLCIPLHYPHVWYKSLSYKSQAISTRTSHGNACFDLVTLHFRPYDNHCAEILSLLPFIMPIPSHDYH